MLIRRIPLLFVLAAVFLTARPAPAQAPAAAGSADARLRALYTAEWTWRQRDMGRSEDPADRSVSDRFPRVDAASQQARLDYWTKTLAALDEIPFDQLSAEERVNARIFRTVIQAQANDIRFRTYEAPFNSDTFFWTAGAPGQGFPNAEGYRRYLSRLRDLPRYFDEQIANMRAGLGRGFSVPRVAIEGRDKTIEPYTTADSTNPLYAPFARIPSSIPESERKEILASATEVFRDVVAPTYVRLLSFIRGEYMPRARTTLAASAMPDGEAFYKAMIEKYTTLDLTAQQIHDIGLREVARIKAEMEATRERAGFKGTMAEFFTFLRTDPQFYAKTPRELLGYSAYVVKQADGKLRDTIGTLPRYRHGLRPVPDAIAPIYTSGRGGLEACLMNTYDLPSRPLYTLAALTLHECTPGHSFQAALALEAPDRPAFRRSTGLRRGLGALHRVARDRDGHLRDALRGLRPADVRDVARVSAGHRHRHPPVRLDARAGAGLPSRTRRALGARDHDGG